MSNSFLHDGRCIDCRANERSLVHELQWPRKEPLRCESKGNEKSLHLERVPTSACSKIGSVLPGSWTVTQPAALAAIQ